MTHHTDQTILQFVTGGQYPSDLLPRYRSALASLVEAPLPRLPRLVHSLPVLMTFYQPVKAKTATDERLLLAIRIAAFVAETHPETVERHVNFKGPGNGLIRLFFSLVLEGIALPVRLSGWLKLREPS